MRIQSRTNYCHSHQQLCVLLFLWKNLMMDQVVKMSFGRSIKTELPCNNRWWKADLVHLQATFSTIAPPFNNIWISGLKKPREYKLLFDLWSSSVECHKNKVYWKPWSQHSRKCSRNMLIDIRFENQISHFCFPWQLNRNLCG